MDLDFSQNFYCHGISILYLNLVSWIRLLGCVLEVSFVELCKSIVSGSNRQGLPSVTVGRMQEMQVFYSMVT